MNYENNATNDETLEFKMGDDSKPLLPEGTYSVQYLKHERRKFQGVDKLYVHFEIVDQGQFNGFQLMKAYNFYLSPPRGSDLFKDLNLLAGKRVLKNSRLSMNLFKGVIILVRVKTVKRDRKQNPLPEYMQYSVIDSILGKETGLET